MIGRCTSLLALVAVLLIASAARADGENDEIVVTLITQIFDSEVATESYDKALENLEAARGVCEGDACSPDAEADLWIAIGTVQALAGKTAAAKKSFVEALKKNPAASLDDNYATDQVKKIFSGAAGAQKTAVAESCRGSFQTSHKKGRGWKSAEAHYCYQQAKSFEEAEEFLACADDARASYELEKRLSTQSLLARCLELGNRWNQAIEQYEAIARTAPKQGQFQVAAQARQRAASLQRQMPGLILKAPNDVADLVVKLDGTEIPLEILGTGEIPVDPGPHKVTATGVQNGTPVAFSQEVLLEPDDTITLLLTLSPSIADPKTEKLLKCLASGKSPEECLQSRSATKGGDLSWRIGVEVSGYHDDMSVDVFTPSVSTGVEHVTDGWGIGAAFLVDIVTAASIDILATASPRWREVRYVPAINGHKKFDDVDVGLRASLSHEPDYLATTVGANVSAELVQKTVTPSFGVEYSHDINGRKDWKEVGLPVNRFAINAGLGLVLDKATFGALAFTFVYEDGDVSKLYRHIPMFSPENAPLVAPGLVIDAVNFFREPERPLEQLPTTRKRFALAGQLAHRLSDATIRGSQRLYIDTWGTKASTTDLRFMYDVMKEFRIWPHGRFHVQSGADFYQLAYVVQRAPDGTALIPQYRTGDRELGPLIAATAGGGARYDFGERREYGLMLTGDFIYTRFLEHLFVLERLGYFGALVFDAELE